MQRNTASLSKLNIRMFILSASLLIGNLAQGAPVEKARYKWVRCKPDRASANCIEEQGPEFEIPQEANSFLPHKIVPVMRKTFVGRPSIFISSGEESGSGVDIASGTELDLGSGMNSNLEHPDILPEPLQSYANNNFVLKLRDEDFIL
ncbi:serglycin [Lissotriton helveticus]